MILCSSQLTSLAHNKKLFCRLLAACGCKESDNDDHVADRIKLPRIPERITPSSKQGVMSNSRSGEITCHLSGTWQDTIRAVVDGERHTRVFTWQRVYEVADG